MDSTRRMLLALAALLALGGLATFLPTWWAPFAEDDYVYLDALADGGGSLAWLVREGVLDHHYRPLSDPLFFLVARTPVAYHAWLTALHAATACLLFALGLELGLDRSSAWLGALVYVTRDFTFASMIWASGFSDIGAAFFAIGALYSYAVWLKRKGAVAWLVSASAFVAAVLTKETAIVTLALFPIVAFVRARDTRKPFEGQAGYWIVALPVAAIQFSLARFDETYGRQIYALSVGSHTLGLWPFYALWCFAAIRELLLWKLARVLVYLATCGALAALGFRMAKGHGRLAATLGAAWFTAAVFPALLAPNRVLTNYLALAAAGPCLVVGAALSHMMRTRKRAWSIAAALLAATLVASGPLLVLAKHRGAINAGGWVDPGSARQMAERVEQLGSEVPAGSPLVVFADPTFHLTVLADPDGRGFGPRSVLASAIRRRYARSDLEVHVLPPIEAISDEGADEVRSLILTAGSEARVVEASDTVRDLTSEALEAARRRGSAADFARALGHLSRERRSR